MEDRKHGEQGDAETERDRLRVRSAELEGEISSAKQELAAKRARLDRGERAPAGPKRHVLGDFGHLIVGGLFVLAVLLVTYLRHRL